MMHGQDRDSAGLFERGRTARGERSARLAAQDWMVMLAFARAGGLLLTAPPLDGALTNSSSAGWCKLQLLGSAHAETDRADIQENMRLTKTAARVIRQMRARFVAGGRCWHFDSCGQDCFVGREGQAWRCLECSGQTAATVTQASCDRRRRMAEEETARWIGNPKR